MSKLLEADWVELGPEPHLATCARCGGTVARPPLPMEMGAFSDYLRDALAEHAGCQEAGDGEDEAAVRRPQPAPAEDADAEAERASPAASDGAAAAAGGVKAAAYYYPIRTACGCGDPECTAAAPR